MTAKQPTKSAKARPPRKVAEAKKTRKPVPVKPAETAAEYEPTHNRPPVPEKSEKSGKTPARSYWRRYKYYVLAFVGALILFGVTVWLARHKIFADWRHEFLRFINNWPDALQPAFVVIATLGSFWTAAVGVVVAFVLRLYQLAWRFALSTMTAYGLLILINRYYDRARPGEIVSDINVRVTEVGQTFPSAHVTVATILSLTLLTYLPYGWRWLIVVMWIGAVALSRLYLGVQAPLDVAAGFALGLGVVCFWRIIPRALKRFMHLK